MKKVVLIAEAMLGGIRQHVFDITLGLDKKEYDVYLIYSDLRADETFFSQLDELNKNVTLIKCNEMLREIGAYDIKAYKRITSILREIKPDIVHCHSSKAGIVGRLAAKRCGVKRIIYTPNAYAFQSPDISNVKKCIYVMAERFLAKYATDLTISVSKGEREQALRYKLDKPNKFELIYNAIPEVEIPSKAELRKRIGLSNDIKYVGFTGRCAAQKDPFTFLNIAKEIIARRENVEFMYIGDGELQEQMQDWVDENGLKSQIHLLGFRKDASEIVGALDVYLSTALYEGLPYSMIEAMRAGVPIIATDCVGNNELVIEKRNGMLFPIKDIETGVTCVLDQLYEKKIRSQDVIDTFKETFSIEKMINRLMMIYTESV